MSKQSRVALASVLALVLFVLGMAAFVPVRLVTVGPVPPPTLEAGLWQPDAQPTLSTVRVTAAPEEALEVALTLAMPEVMNPDLVRTRQKPDERGVYRVDPESPMTVAGFFGDVTVTALSGSGHVSRGVEKVPLSAGTSVTLLSPQTNYMRATSMLWRTVDSGLTDESARIDLRAYVAGVPVVTNQGRVLVSDMFWPALRTVLSGLFVFLGVTAVMALLWLLGRHLDPEDEVSAQREALRTLAAGALLITTLNSLAYLVPVSRAMWVILAMCVFAMCSRWWRARPEGISASARAGLPLLGMAIVPALVLFFPLFLWGPSYGGEFKTDLFEYSTVSALTRDHSLFALQQLPAAQESGTLAVSAGFSWRSIDSVLASGISEFTGSTITAFAVAGVMLFAFYALGLLALSAVRGGGRWSTVVTLLTLFAPAFTGLFIENYFSQYFLLAFAPALLLAAWMLLRRGAQTGRWYAGWLTWSLAAIAAIMTAAYPYFLVIIAAGLLVAALLHWKTLKRAWRVLPLALVLTLVLTNLALLTVVRFGEASSIQAGLDALTRNVLLQTFGPRDLVELMVGLDPYQWRFSGMPVTDAVGSPAKQIWSLASDAANNGQWELLAVTALGVVAVMAISWRRSLREYGFTAAAAIVVIWALFTAYNASSGSLYVALKSAWTLAALLPLIAATAMFRRQWQPVLCVMLAVAAVLWTRTTVADKATWVGLRDWPIPSHQSVQPEIDAIRPLLAGVQTVFVVRGDQPLAGSDRDRVVSAQAGVLSLDVNADCPNCRFNFVEPELDCSAVTASPTPFAIITVGTMATSELCSTRRVYAGRVLDLFIQQT